MAGMLPAARALRAPPLPRPGRRAPFNKMTAMDPPCVATAGAAPRASSRAARDSDEQRTQRALLVDALHGLAQQAGHRQLPHVRGNGTAAVVDRVGRHDLLDG